MNMHVLHLSFVALALLLQASPFVVQKTVPVLQLLELVRKILQRITHRHSLAAGCIEYTSQRAAEYLTTCCRIRKHVVCAAQKMTLTLCSSSKAEKRLSVGGWGFG